MKKTAILIIDDSPEDVEAYRRLLREASEDSFIILAAESGQKGLDALKTSEIDCVLLDFQLPDTKDLELLKEISLKNKPIILLTGHGNEKIAVEAMKNGAMDYLSKNNIDGAVLIRSIRYAMAQKKTEIEKENLIIQLQEALSSIKTLSGLLPICCVCKKIRDEEGSWKPLEVYISGHSEALFSHGYCPECSNELSQQLREVLKKRG